MPDVPVVTVVDPADRGRPTDLLDTGEPRPPRRWPAVVLVVGLLGAAGAAGGRSLLERRAEQQARDAAFAIADEVHLQGRLGAVYGFFPGPEQVLSAEVEVSASGGDRGGDRIAGVRFDGEGLTTRTPDLAGQSELPAVVRPESDVDCRAVAAGRYPRGVVVLFDVVPRSGVTHTQRLPVDDPVLRTAVLQACDLPDPDAVPLVEVQGVRGQLLLSLETVQRSDDALTLERVEVPGFAVGLPEGLTLPRVLPPDSSGFYAFDLAVVDCAVARTSRRVTVALQVGGVRKTRVADPDTSQPQPGGEPVAVLLDRLVAADC